MCPFKFIFRTDVNRANWGVNLAHLPRWVEKNRRDTKFCVLTAIFCVLPANMGNYAKDICGKDAKSCVLTLFLPGHKMLCSYAILPGHKILWPYCLTSIFLKARLSPLKTSKSTPCNIPLTLARLECCQNFQLVPYTTLRSG